MYQKTGQDLSLSYEKIYFSLWELGQRYGSFTDFRVIGKSHDERMIPLLEIGKGEEAVFCISGIQGTENRIPGFLTRLAEEYCRAYECRWLVENFYDVRELLDTIRICMIPLLNPDGYEICQTGWSGIRNPVYRQMLKMNGIPEKEFTGNARGIDLKTNFPTLYCQKTQMGKEPGSENETKALICLLQDYGSRGFLSFTQKPEKVIRYCHTRGMLRNQRNSRLARYLRKCDASFKDKARKEREGIGSPEQFYTEKIKETAMEIELSFEGETEKIFRDMLLFPLEYLFSLVS